MFGTCCKYPSFLIFRDEILEIGFMFNLIGMYRKVCVPSAPVCLVSVLEEETHFISKTAHRGQSGRRKCFIGLIRFKVP